MVWPPHPISLASDAIRISGRGSAEPISIRELPEGGRVAAKK
jgi:hypothetical protein